LVALAEEQPEEEDLVARRPEAVVVVPAAVVARAAAYLAEIAAGEEVPEIAGRTGAEAVNSSGEEEVEVVVLGAGGESIRMADPKAAGSSWRASPFLHQHVLKKGHSVRVKNLRSTCCPRAMEKGEWVYRWAGMVVVGVVAAGVPACRGCEAAQGESDEMAAGQDLCCK
jgi:hypothetical protein